MEYDYKSELLGAYAFLQGQVLTLSERIDNKELAEKFESALKELEKRKAAIWEKAKEENNNG